MYFFLKTHKNKVHLYLRRYAFLVLFSSDSSPNVPPKNSLDAYIVHTLFFKNVFTPISRYPMCSSYSLVSSLQLPYGLGRGKGQQPCILRNTTQPGHTASWHNAHPTRKPAAPAEGGNTVHLATVSACTKKNLWHRRQWLFQIYSGPDHTNVDLFGAELITIIACV